MFLLLLSVVVMILVVSVGEFCLSLHEPRRFHSCESFHDFDFVTFDLILLSCR